MKQSVCLLLVFLIVMACGCGALNVRVDILDINALKDSPAWVEAEVSTARSAAIMNLQQGASGDNWFRTTGAHKAIQFEQRYEVIDRALRKRAQYLDNPEPTAADVPDTRIMDAYENAERLSQEGVSLYDEATAIRDNPSERMAKLLLARERFRQAEESIASAMRNAERELDNPVIESLKATVRALDSNANPTGVSTTTTRSSTERNEIRNEIERALVVAAEGVKDARQTAAQLDQAFGFIGDKGIAKDSRAPLVVHADDVFWHAPSAGKDQRPINRVQAFGAFGNTDMAIRMVDVGEFTLKGVRVDASKVTEASFAAVETGIRIAAASIGVPPGVLTPKTGASTQPSDEVDPADLVVAETEAQAIKARAAAVRIMQTVIAESDKLSDDNQRAAAATRIRAVYSANRSLLAGETSATGDSE